MATPEDVRHPGPPAPPLALMSPPDPSPPRPLPMLDQQCYEHLMVDAYNRKLKQTPFERELHMAAPTVSTNPFRVNPDIVKRVVGGG